MALPPLYQRDTRGKIREWVIKVEPQPDKTALIVSEAGIIGMKYTKSSRHIKKGKNIGKSNETTAVQQAISEAQSMWQKRVDSGMLQDKDAAETHEPVFPMLAHRFADHGDKRVRYPAYVQTKLDGVRCIACVDNGRVRLISRKNKEFNFLEHIREDILALGLRDGFYLDGELFTKELSFEEIVGLCRKDKRITETERKKMLKIKYHVYDCIDMHNKQLSFEERHHLLTGTVYRHKLNVVLVETRLAKDFNQVNEYYDIFYNGQGYEGAMVRNAKDSPYGINKRSYDLLKMKEFEDSEFEIIGFKEATGNDAGTIVWLCKDSKSNGHEFDVRPKATREVRGELFQAAKNDFSQFKGKQLTVQYQGLTNGDIPRFPVGIGIRDYE